MNNTIFYRHKKSFLCKNHFSIDEHAREYT